MKIFFKVSVISNVNEPPEKRRQRLEASWAGPFRREFFSRLNEDTFAVLYSEIPPRPNVPVNMLVSLDTLKAGFGWSDEELYDHFLYDLQVRYVLGYDSAPREVLRGQHYSILRGLTAAARDSLRWRLVSA